MDRSTRSAPAERRRAYFPEYRERRRGPSPAGLLLAGLAVAGLGMLAWNYVGADLVRYWKIENM
jgi:hypothetical protein